MTKGTVSATKWKQKRWLRKSRAARVAGETGLERREIERKANQSLTAQLVAAEQFAQIMCHRRSVDAQEGQALATLTTGAAGATVKAEKSVHDRAKRKVVLKKLDTIMGK